jgi:hypothetical protein
MRNDSLKILPTNKTVVLYSPIMGDDVLVRTGTLPDGESFFHAVLHGQSTDYASMNKTGRKKLVSRTRCAVTKNAVDRAKWESLSDGLLARVSFHEYETKILEDFYRTVKLGGSCKSRHGRIVARALIIDDRDRDAYSLVTEMIDMEHLIKTVIPGAKENNDSGTVSEYCKLVVESGVRSYTDIFSSLRKDDPESLDDESVKYYLDKFSLMMTIITREAGNGAFEEYINGLGDSTITVTKQTMAIVAREVGRDIYFIDADSRMPYLPYDDNEKIDCQPPVTGRRKAVVIMCTSGSHFEVVGKLYEGRRVKRSFSSNDDFIRRINTFLYEPNSVPDRYPDLVKYLPKEIRRGYGMTASDSDRSDSESRYESSAYEESDDDKGIFTQEPTRKSTRKSFQ